MRFEESITYPSTSAAEVYALIVDPQFQAEVCEETGAIDYEVDVDEAPDTSATVTTNRVLPAAVPDFAKKFVGDTIEVRQVVDWSTPDDTGERTGELSLDVAGQPAKLTGTVRLTHVGADVVQQISGDLKVAVPLIGKKLEAEIAKGLVAGVRVEEKVARRRLAG